MINSKIIINKHYKGINPKICGWQDCEPKHFYGPAVRSYWLLHFVVSGKGIFKTPRGEYSLGKNDIFIIRPYDVTYYEADAEEPWNYIWIGFSSDIKLPSALIGNDTIYAPFLSDVFQDCIKADDISSNGKGFEAYMCSRIWDMIAKLEEKYVYSSALSDGYIRAAINIMETEYHSGITVEDIADRLHLNRSYFSTLFKKIINQSPREYLIALRMEKAAELLCKMRLSVSVTATSVGYPDVFAFSRAFKNYYEVSPTDYTKTQRA